MYVVVSQSEFGHRDQIEGFCGFWRILQQWQELFEVFVFGCAQKFKDDRLECGEMSTCITHGLDANVAIWKIH